MLEGGAELVVLPASFCCHSRPFAFLFDASGPLPVIADDYLAVLSLLEDQGRKFNEMNKRPAVLVMDAVEDLEKGLMEEMIRRAKVPSIFRMCATLLISFANRCLCYFGHCRSFIRASHSGLFVP